MERILFMFYNRIIANHNTSKNGYDNYHTFWRGDLSAGIADMGFAAQTERGNDTAKRCGHGHVAATIEPSKSDAGCQTFGIQPGHPAAIRSEFQYHQGRDAKI